MTSAPADPLVRRLTAFGTLGPGEIDLLREAIQRPASVGPRADLSSQNGKGAKARLLVAGWAARQRVLSDGRRQIVGFVLPGDFVSFSLHRAPLRYANTVTLTQAVLAEADMLLEACTAQSYASPLAATMRAIAAVEEALLAHHVTRLGRQTAYERLSHLFLELRERLALAGIEPGDTFTLPMTQEVLADALGLSVVHTNRTLQQLRRDGLIRMSGVKVTLVDAAALAALSDYVPLTRLVART
ncbi:Crp/Fnr family transcriptional regulator [Methylobacterium nigriterrae]|uniref:Crp/Fnr family transcriptional regulator n=1 Tax=Methylobacterium nigriterrae TaxID=3127512 RepID=UPI0030140590